MEAIESLEFSVHGRYVHRSYDKECASWVYFWAVKLTIDSLGAA